MRSAVAIACLGLLACQPAGAAEPTYSLTVSRHPDVRKFSDNEIKRRLREASAVMRRAGCPVTFKLDGHVRTFSSDKVPDDIVTTGDLDKVHSEPTDVKIVKEIKCCVERKPQPGKMFEGCSWPPKKGSRSIILTESGATLGNRWAHEFGHRMGLPHRAEANALMTGGGVSRTANKVDRVTECPCFRNEGSCTLSVPAPPPAAEKCPE